MDFLQNTISGKLCEDEKEDSFPDNINNTSEKFVPDQKDTQECHKRYIKILESHISTIEQDIVVYSKILESASYIENIKYLSEYITNLRDKILMTKKEINYHQSKFLDK